MASSIDLTRQVHVAELPAFGADVASRLAAPGRPASELETIFAESIRAHCVTCGIELSGADLHQLALVDVHDPSAFPKLARLKQGYCARKDCSSRFFLVEFLARAGLEWPAVLEPAPAAAAAASDPAALTKAGVRSAAFQAARRKFLFRVGIGLAIVALLLLIRFFQRGGTIPGFTPEPKYRVDPASVTNAP
ncbi:MAG TPA: hypothetical protein P5555_01495 [Candidatus Paceibacterota bacterium]|nr:hypothetical protein [Verrucomicrobiota bacterium]HRZ43848.1 hypothetical protein [Candidatus Paceibacterota bacterium]HRZ92571.1 hypothetical protein [Candidatus Paceibacterota bacterium]